MKGFSWVFLIVAVLFLSLSAGMFFGTMIPEWKNESIAKNGTRITAAIVSVPLHGNDKHYKINFEYEYPADSGNIRKGSTNAVYTYEEAFAAYDQGRGTIEIAVSKSGKAVALDYRRAPVESIRWVMVALFACLGIGAGVAFTIIAIVSAKNKNSHKKNHN